MVVHIMATVTHMDIIVRPLWSVHKLFVLVITALLPGIMVEEVLTLVVGMAEAMVGVGHVDPDNSR